MKEIRPYFPHKSKSIENVLFWTRKPTWIPWFVTDAFSHMKPWLWYFLHVRKVVSAVSISHHCSFLRGRAACRTCLTTTTTTKKNHHQEHTTEGVWRPPHIPGQPTDCIKCARYLLTVDRAVRQTYNMYILAWSFLAKSMIWCCNFRNAQPVFISAGFETIDCSVWFSEQVNCIYHNPESARSLFPPLISSRRVHQFVCFSRILYELQQHNRIRPLNCKHPSPIIKNDTISKNTQL